MSKFHTDKFLNKITGNDDLTRYLGRDAVKRLKELGIEPVWKDWDTSFDLL